MTMIRQSTEIQLVHASTFLPAVFRPPLAQPTSLQCCRLLHAFAQ